MNTTPAHSHSSNNWILSKSFITLTLLFLFSVPEVEAQISVADRDHLNSEIYAAAASLEINRNRDFGFPLAAGIAFQEMKPGSHFQSADVLKHYHRNLGSFDKLTYSAISQSGGAPRPTGRENVEVLAMLLGAATVAFPPMLPFSAGFGLGAALSPHLNFLFAGNPNSANQASFEKDWAPSLLEGTPINAASTAIKYQDIESEAMSQAYQLYHSCSECRPVIEEINQGHVHVNLASSGPEILKNNFSKLPGYPTLKSLVNRAETGQPLEYERVEGLAESFEREASHSLRTSVYHVGRSAELKDEHDKNKGADQDSHHARDIREDRERAESEHRIHAMESLEVGGRLVTLLLKLDGHGGQHLSHKFDTIFNNTIFMAKTLEKISESAFGIGSAMLTLNVVSAFMNIVGAFGDVGPTENQMILTGIDNIRNDIQSLSTHLHGRFDRVDARLNQIMETTVAGFNLLLRQGGEIRLDLAHAQHQIFEVQQKLYNLGLQMDQFQLNLSEMIVSGFNDATMAKIAVCLSKNNSNIRGLSFDSYHQCKVEIIRYATESALARHLVPSLPVSDLPLNNKSLESDSYRQFLSNPLNSSLDGLTIIGREVFSNAGMHSSQVGSADAFIPNFATWYVGSNAYLKLARQYPDFEGLSPASDLNPLLAMGGRIKSALRSITLQPTESGSRPNFIFFSNIVHAYRETAVELVQALKTEFNQLKNRVAQGVDPWGSMDQELLLEVSSPIVSKPCQTSGPLKFEYDRGDRTMPRNTLKLVPRAYRMAAKLELGPLTVCHGDTIPNGDGSFGLHFRFRFKDKVIKNVVITLDAVPLASGVDWVKTMENNLTAKWKREGESIVAGLTINQEDGPADLIAEVKQKLTANRAVVATHLGESLLTPSAHKLIMGLGNIQKLLQTYLLLGLPRSMQNNDDLRADFFGPDKFPDAVILTQVLQSCQTSQPNQCESGPIATISTMIEKRTELFLSHIRLALSVANSGDLPASLDGSLRDLAVYSDRLRSKTKAETPAQVIQALKTFINEFRAANQ